MTNENLAATAATENLTDQQKENKQTALLLFSATIDMAKSKINAISNPFEKEMVLGAIKEYALTTDFYEKTIHITTINTILFGSLINYVKLMQKVLNKYEPKE